MAGLQGFGAGLLQGYETVSRVQDRKRARGLQQQRIDNTKDYRDRSLGLQQTQITQDQKNADRNFGLKQKQLDFKRSQAKAKNARADRELDIAQDKAKASIRSSDALTGYRRAATRHQEVETANAQRAQREQDNVRYIEVALDELNKNGVTPRFRDFAQKSGNDVDKLLDSDWQDSLDTLKTGLQGGPISRKAMVDAGNTFFNDRIERMVGQETPDGKTIVRSRLADFYPGPNGETAVMDLDVWTRDKNGKVEKYRAPATSNRRTDDEYVLEVPMDQLIGNIAATDAANRMVDKQRLAGMLEQQAKLNGANDPANISGNGWRKLSGNTLYNRNSGETKEIESVADETERRSKAVDFARGDLQSLEEARSPVVRDMNDNQRQQWLLKKIKYYESVLAPDGGESAPAGDDPVVIRDNPQFGDVTESDIQTTMQETGMSRAEVMERLNGA